MKKKGFTLVELLAVIVILAIIALITVPIVLKTISNSEVQAEKQSIDGYARVIEDDKANEEMLHPGQQYQIKPEEEYDYKGNKVFCQERYFDEKDKLVLKNCYVSETKLSDEEAAKQNHYNYENGKVELIKNNNKQSNNQGNNENTENNDNNTNNTNNNKTYEIGEEVTVKNEKYNVIGQGIDYVTLLKQQPLTVEEVNANKIGSDNVNHVNKNTYSSVGEAYNYNGYGGMAYYSSSTCGYVTPGDGSSYTSSGCASENATSYDTSDIKYVVEEWARNKFNLSDLKEINNYRVRLITKEELEGLGCTSNYCTNSPHIWTYAPNYEYWYWTMSPYNSSTIVWSVFDNGGLGSNGVRSSYGGAVRPVINVYKSKLS